MDYIGRTANEAANRLIRLYYPLVSGSYKIERTEKAIQCAMITVKYTLDRNGLDETNERILLALRLLYSENTKRLIKS